MLHVPNKRRSKRGSVLPMTEEEVIDRVTEYMREQDAVELEQRLREEFSQMDKYSSSVLSIHQFRTFMASLITRILSEETGDGDSLKSTLRTASAINPWKMQQLVDEVERRILEHPSSKDAGLTDIPQQVHLDFVCNLPNFLMKKPLKDPREFVPLYEDDIVHTGTDFLPLPKTPDSCVSIASPQSGLPHDSAMSVMLGQSPIRGRNNKILNLNATGLSARTNFSRSSRSSRPTFGTDIDVSGMTYVFSDQAGEDIGHVTTLCSKMVRMMTEFETSITKEVAELRQSVLSQQNPQNELEHDLDEQANVEAYAELDESRIENTQLRERTSELESQMDLLLRENEGLRGTLVDQERAMQRQAEFLHQQQNVEVPSGQSDFSVVANSLAISIEKLTKLVSVSMEKRQSHDLIAPSVHDTNVAELRNELDFTKREVAQLLKERERFYDRERELNLALLECREKLADVSSSKRVTIQSMELEMNWMRHELSKRSKKIE